MNSLELSSGPWAGFYTQGDSMLKHHMELDLTFAAGTVIDDGLDDIGPFLIKGRYNLDTCEVSCMKSYIGGHGIYYRGFSEGNIISEN
jgi:hypothetical protein